MKKLTLILLQLLIVFSAVAQDIVKYSTVDLRMRLDTTTNSEIITTIPRGTTVILPDDCDCKWILVKYNGRVGYVYSKYLSNTPTTIQKQDVVKHYTNSAGERVQSPTYYNVAPAGATALCRDGTYSFSRSRRGTCSHHGGVKIWL